MNKRITSFIAACCVVASLIGMAVTSAVAANQRISFIRDAEIEGTIRAYATPIFKTAGLDPQAINVHLVNDNALNAFVAGGMHMFINTGLLLRADHAGEVVGVIAHETGHIAGGHIVRGSEAMEHATYESILAMVLGAAAAIGSGNPEVGIAVMGSGTQVAERSLLAYSRNQESSADQAGVSFLDQSGQSSRGFLQFMEILGDQDLLQRTRQDPYVLTHPMTRERIEFLRNHVANSPYSNVPVPIEFAERHQRMQAKLFAFLNPPGRTLQKYKETDHGLVARYARAIALYRRPDLPAALELINGLIAERPKDPYFQELKGQMLFENGHGAEALAPYEESVRLSPDSALLRMELAHAQIETNDDHLLPAAIANLKRATQRESDNNEAWRLTAIAYGRSGDMGNSTLAQAEAALAAGHKEEAQAHANRALQALQHGSPGWLRAQDILAAGPPSKK